MRSPKPDFFNKATPRSGNLIFQREQVVAPELLIPGKKPVGPVKLTTGTSLVNGLKVCLPFNQSTQFYDLASKTEWVPGSGISFMKEDGYFGFGGQDTDINNYIKSALTTDQMGLTADVTILAMFFVRELPASTMGIIALNGSLHSDWLFIDIQTASKPRLAVGSSFTSGSVASPNFVGRETRLMAVAGSSTGSPKQLYVNGVLDIDTTGQDTSLAADKKISLSRVDSITDSGRMLDGFWTYLCIWDRHLTETELQSTCEDPYQILESAL